MTLFYAFEMERFIFTKKPPAGFKSGKPAAPKAEGDQTPRETPPAGGGVLPVDLEKNMCRWPIGDPRLESFVFCGKEIYPGTPYCQEHALRAYQGRSAPIIHNSDAMN